MGEYYHVLSRGNNRQALFNGKNDFLFYLDGLGRYQLKYRISLFHYCLMTNHVHLLIRSHDADDSITKFMHGVQMSYARYFIKKHEATGHVFEDRFKHLHIDSEGYLLECGRYIERNPLRAGMVENLRDYPWSSYAFYGHGEVQDLLTPNPLYETMGATEKERQQAYREYLETPRPYERVVDRFFDERILI